MLQKRITVLVQDILKEALNSGDTAVDLTAGNGYDTCFLAGCVGKDGQVYAFDIQSVAIEKTNQLLLQHQLRKQVNLIEDGHEHVDRYVKDGVKVAMMNLGYLPSGNKVIITNPDTTCRAINKILELLISDHFVYAFSSSHSCSITFIYQTNEGITQFSFKCTLKDSFLANNCPIVYLILYMIR